MSIALSVPLNPRSMRMFFAVLANSEKLGAIFFGLSVTVTQAQGTGRNSSWLILNQQTDTEL